MREAVVLSYDDTPPSLNGVAGRNVWHYRKEKKRWGQILEGLLLAERVPRGLTSVKASAVLSFTLNRKRDEGNFRFFLEKALGDALWNGGWLADDTPDQYRFGTVDFRRGDVKQTEITLEYER